MPRVLDIQFTGQINVRRLFPLRQITVCLCTTRKLEHKQGRQ